jgi:acyl carrier protein
MIDREAIRAQISELLVSKGDTRPFTDGEALLVTARLDSMDVVQLVAFVEQAYGVDFAAVAFAPELFESVDSMAAFLASVAEH